MELRFRFASLLALTLLAGAQNPPPKGGPSWNYLVEWRMVDAGQVRFGLEKDTDGYLRAANLHLYTIGLLNKLYRVNDHYVSRLDEQLCTTSVSMKAEEGRRRRETEFSFDREARRSKYHEKDLLKNATVLATELELPGCTNDPIGALMKLRTLRVEPGSTLTLPVSDGKKVVAARIDAQVREKVKVPAGVFNCIRYEAFLFNDVLYKRSGHLHVWLSDDERRLPVQITVRLPFYIGTINVMLEKEVP